MANLLELSFELDGLDPEAAELACFGCGAGSVTLVDSRDDPILEPLPGELRLWPATRVRALFTLQAAAGDLRGQLSAALGVPAEFIAAQEIPDRVWEREWLKDFHAQRFGRRLWVCPHHERIAEPDAVVVHLDPGMAFGTGNHPSTALCLEWLDGHLADAERVIDYGCGSGVLAVAALKLGARLASCFDIDAQALIAARENAAVNGVAERLIICLAAQDLEAHADVLLANILAEPLMQLAPRFARLTRAGGHVVLAGLLESQESSVTGAYDAWFDMRAFGRREGWIGLVGRRREDAAI
jgi:ribosomal protein L11 methyltransferase